jgi:hypothetical protein
MKYRITRRRNSTGAEPLEYSEHTGQQTWPIHCREGRAGPARRLVGKIDQYAAAAERREFKNSALPDLLRWFWAETKLVRIRRLSAGKSYRIIY